MSFFSILSTIFEFCMVALLFWCFFHEDRLISFERKIITFFRRRKLRVIKTVNFSTVANVNE